MGNKKNPVLRFKFTKILLNPSIYLLYSINEIDIPYFIIRNILIALSHKLTFEYFLFQFYISFYFKANRSRALFLQKSVGM